MHQAPTEVFICADIFPLTCAIAVIDSTTSTILNNDFFPILLHFYF